MDNIETVEQIEPEIEEKDKGWVLTEEEKVAWCDQYNTPNVKYPSFPMMFVPCTQCGSSITMYGTNLRGRVQKFGSARKLLDTFVCVRCVRRNKAAMPYTLKIPVKKHLKTASGISITDIPKVTQTVHEGYSSEDLAKNPELCVKMTKGNCWKPQLYLNNGKHCHGGDGDCNLFEHCASTVKRK